MADEDNVAPLPTITTLKKHHRRSASASAEFASNRAPNTVTTSKITLAGQNASNTTKPARQPRLPRSFSSSALLQSGQSYFGHQRRTIKRGKEWDSEINDPNKLVLNEIVSARLKMFEPNRTPSKGKPKPKEDAAPPGSSEFFEATMSPRYPESKLESASPFVSDTYASPSRQSSEGAPAQPTRPEDDAPLNNVSAFDYAMRPYMENFENYLQLTERLQQATALRISSPLLPVSRVAEPSTPEREQPVEHHVFNERITDLERDNSLATRIQRIMVRTYLIRCSILQSTVQEIARKPYAWARKQEHQPIRYHMEILDLASKAKRIAEGLKAKQLDEATESDELYARCQYWMGRGSCDLKDYGAAEEHLREARRADEGTESGKPRGLRPSERVDMELLLNEVSKRSEEHKKRTQDPRWLGQRGEERSGKESPPLYPDRERIARLADGSHDARFDIDRHLDEDDDSFDPEVEEKVRAQYAAEGFKPKAKGWRFGMYERRYILHGEKLRRGSEEDAEKVQPVSRKKAVSSVEKSAGGESEPGTPTPHSAG